MDAKLGNTQLLASVLQQIAGGIAWGLCLAVLWFEFWVLALPLLAWREFRRSRRFEGSAYFLGSLFRFTSIGGILFLAALAPTKYLDRVKLNFDQTSMSGSQFAHHAYLESRGSIKVLCDLEGARQAITIPSRQMSLRQLIAALNQQTNIRPARISYCGNQTSVLYGYHHIIGGITFSSPTIAKLEEVGARVRLLPPGTILEVEFAGDLVSDEHLSLLRRLDSVRSLSLGGQVSDAGLSYLDHLADLESLNLTGLGVTDAGLAHLSRFPNLKHLYLAATSVVELQPICDLTQLKHLSLSETAVADAGVKRAAQLPQLTSLYLGRTRVSDQGLEGFRQAKQLERLGLQGTSVTSIGLQHLSQLNYLTVLDLAETAVDDAGIEHLLTLKKLANLNLTGTAVTEDGIAKLRTALPDCQIRR